jgi:hypothetical protein
MANPEVVSLTARNLSNGHDSSPVQPFLDDGQETRPKKTSITRCFLSSDCARLCTSLHTLCTSARLGGNIVGGPGYGLESTEYATYGQETQPMSRTEHSDRQKKPSWDYHTPSSPDARVLSGHAHSQGPVSFLFPSEFHCPRMRGRD